MGFFSSIKSFVCKTKHNTKQLFKPGYTAMFISMSFNSNQLDFIDKITIRILANKARYINVAREFNMPWQVIGVIHYLEGDMDFNTILHNGERLPIRRTKLVPKGRGPFTTWEEAARDAISIERKRPKVWTIEATLNWLEGYNGYGYRKRGINSPYIWSGTNYYKKGKYGSDGRYKKFLVSKQIGAAPLLKRLGLFNIK